MHRASRSTSTCAPSSNHRPSPHPASRADRRCCPSSVTPRGWSRTAPASRICMRTGTDALSSARRPGTRGGLVLSSHRQKVRGSCGHPRPSEGRTRPRGPREAGGMPGRTARAGSRPPGPPDHFRPSDPRCTRSHSPGAASPDTRYDQGTSWHHHLFSRVSRTSKEDARKSISVPGPDVVHTVHPPSSR